MSTEPSNTTTGDVAASIVLNVMGLRDLAVYGFRSWLLQRYERPYEVILNLFYPCRELFDPLLEGANPNCIARIYQYEQPAFFNISASNNLGLHHSRGRYVAFANSDIIYPTNYLSRMAGELEARDAYYAVAARVNMTQEESQQVKVKPPQQYTLPQGFDSLIGLERRPGADIWYAISPWMLRRDIAMAIGGFDPRVLQAEDRDISSRVMHYLRRRGLQQSLVAFIDLFGYHQHHGNTGLMNAHFESKAIIDNRIKQMDADADSAVDTMPTRLTDYDALLEDVRQTKAPPPMNAIRKDWHNKIGRRVKKVWRAALYGK